MGKPIDDKRLCSPALKYTENRAFCQGALSRSHGNQFLFGSEEKTSSLEPAQLLSLSRLSICTRRIDSAILHSVPLPGQGANEGSWAGVAGL